MNKSIILASAMLLNTGYIHGFGVTIGPFDFEFGEVDRGVYGGYVRSNDGRVLESPICQAISQHQRVEFLVENRELLNSKEMKITTNKIVVEPYAFGFTNNGMPVLRGVVTDEKLVKEVTIKLGEEPKNMPVVQSDKKDKDDFASLFRSHKSSDGIESLNLSKALDMQVLDGERFEPAKNLDSIFKDDISRVLCQIAPQPASK